MGPVPRQKQIAHSVVVTCDNNIPRPQQGLDAGDHIRRDPLTLPVSLDEGLPHFRNHTATELEQLKHDFLVSRNVAPLQGVQAIMQFPSYIVLFAVLEILRFFIKKLNQALHVLISGQSRDIFAV